MQLLVAEPLKQKIGEDFDPPRSEPSGRRHPVHFAIECARQYPLGLDRPTPVEVLLTGGGHSLPMVKEFVTKPPIPWKYLSASPEIPDGPLEEGFRAVHRQLAVAIGGAVRIFLTRLLLSA
jgi:hypothetical protein